MFIECLKKNWYLILIFILVLVAIAAFIAVLNGWEFAIIFLVGIFVVSSIYCGICYLIRDCLVLDENVNIYHEELYCLDKIRRCLSKNAFGITVTFLATLILALAPLYIYPPAQIILEPKNFDENITFGNQSAKTISINKTISIKNIGADLASVNLSTEGMIGWISINPESLPKLESGKREFALVTIPPNENAGEYRGAIIIQANASYTLRVLGYSLLLKNVTGEIGEIPVVLHVKRP